MFRGDIVCVCVHQNNMGFFLNNKVKHFISDLAALEFCTARLLREGLLSGF